MTTHNLPHQPTPFIGRVEERAKVGELLNNPDCRLLTLLGPGGIGKTRLALQAAADQLANFPHGVFFVPLAAINTTNLIPAAIANALQISVQGSDAPNTQIIAYLHDKHALLVMDNFEHVLDGTAFLTDILQSAIGVKFLVTSRERLNLQEEWGLPLYGLGYPTGETHLPLESFSAVQLFVQRAHHLNPDFSLIKNSEAVKAICQALEGMPLGLELAATWLRVMTCQQISTQMTTNLDFLTTTIRNVPERHRSIRAIFEQSWQMLAPAERDVLMRLALFRGGCDHEAAQQVAGASLPLLASLTDKSMLRTSDNGRYNLHELVRQFAADKLHEAGQTTATADRLLDYCLTLGAYVEANLWGRGQIPAFDKIETELDNIRAALAWSLQGGSAEKGLQLVAALGWFFSERNYCYEGLVWLERLLAATPNASAYLRAKGWQNACALAGMNGDKRAEYFCKQALTVARANNDLWNVAWALSHFGFHKYENHDVAEALEIMPALTSQSSLIHRNPDEALAALEESIVLFRQLDDRMGLCHTLNRRAMRGIVGERDYAYAYKLMQEASPLAEEAGDLIMLAWIQYNFGLIAKVQEDDFWQAKQHFEKSLAYFVEARFEISTVLMELAFVEQALGNLTRAQYCYCEALSLQKGTPSVYAYILAGLASVAYARGQATRAAVLLATVPESAIASFAYLFADNNTYERDQAAVREQLGEAAFAEAWAFGKAMTLEQIIAYARQDSGNDDAISAPARLQTRTQKAVAPLLNEREVEILTLAAEGLSNREIAERLILALSTVKWYMSEILSKLDAQNRTQAIARARELGLL